CSNQKRPRADVRGYSRKRRPAPQIAMPELTLAPPDFSHGVAYVGGAYVPVDDARIPLLDWGFLRSDANQDTISAWNGLVFRFDDEGARCRGNIERLRMVSPAGDGVHRTIVLECLRKPGSRDAYVQTIMPRGRPPIGIRDPRRCINQFYAFCVPYIWVATPEKQ